MSVQTLGRRDLQLQLLAVYLLFILPILGLAVYFYLAESHRLRQDVTAADLSLARAIALETDIILQRTQAAVTSYAQTPDVIEANLGRLETFFSAGVMARQDINLFYRLSAGGVMLYHYPLTSDSTVGQDFSFRDYFQQAKASRGHVFSQGRISPTTGRPVVTSAMPIWNGGHFAGVVAANLDLQRLTETVQQISQKRSAAKSVEIMVIDATGQVIAHSDPALLLVKLPAGLPALQAVLAGTEGAVTAVDNNGQEALYSYTPVPTAGWGVIVRHPTKLAFVSLERFQNGFILALMLVVFGSLLFWFTLANRVISPLVQLTRYGENASQQLAGANLSLQTIEPLARRQDQIGRLARTLLKAEQDIRRRLVELTTLNKTSRSVVSPLDPQQVIDTILDEVQRLFQIRQCALLQVDKKLTRLTFRASRGLSQSYVSQLNQIISTKPLPAYQAIESGEPVQVPDITADDHFTNLLPLAQAEGYRSLLAVPLIATHVPPTVLMLYRPDVYTFNRQEIDLATSFANYAAIALEHATLFSLTDAELQQQVQFLSALNQVGHTVSQSLLVDDVLNNAIDKIFAVMPIDACWICLRRNNEDFLRLRAYRGLPAGLIDQIEAEGNRYDQGVMGYIVQHGQPLVLDEARLAQPDWALDPVVTVGGWRLLAAAPLAYKESIIGALGIASQDEPAFASTEVSLLQAIGDQIAIAVVNAWLYRRSREAATLEERNRVAREIHDTLAQGFTGIIIHLQTAERLHAQAPAEALQSLREAHSLARLSLHEARRSVLNLRPGILENLTLDQALAQHVQQFAAETGLEATFHVKGYPSSLEVSTEHNLYRIAQEALTNVKRHAQARRVAVGLTFARHSVALTITDDGRGLDPARRQQLAANGHGDLLDQSHGWGLRGIQERVSQIGGQVTFETPDGGGVQIKVVVKQ